MTEHTNDGIVILGGGTQQVPLIQTAMERGLHTTVLEPNPGALGADLADRFVVTDLANWEHCRDAVCDTRPRGIATFAADFPIPMLARLCGEFGLPGITPETARAATDKAVMRAAFECAGVPAPHSVGVSDLAEAMNARRALGGHVIVKPSRSSGSRGVVEVGAGDDDSILRTAFTEALALVDPGKPDPVLIETVADGPEVSVETVSIDGTTTVLAITDKITTGAPEYVEVGHLQPSAFHGKERAAIEQVAVAAIDAIGLRTGIGHTEIRVGADGPKVIETAARAGGGYIMSRLLPLTTGVNALSLTLDLALGVATVPSPRTHGAAAVRFLDPSPGVVTGLWGVDAAHALDGVVEVSVEVACGDTVNPLRDTRDRIGHIVAIADEAEDARELAAEAAASIRIETTP